MARRRLPTASRNVRYWGAARVEFQLTMIGLLRKV